MAVTKEVIALEFDVAQVSRIFSNEKTSLRIYTSNNVQQKVLKRKAC